MCSDFAQRGVGRGLELRFASPQTCFFAGVAIYERRESHLCAICDIWN